MRIILKLSLKPILSLKLITLVKRFKFSHGNSYNVSNHSISFFVLAWALELRTRVGSTPLPCSKVGTLCTGTYVREKNELNESASRVIGKWKGGWNWGREREKERTRIEGTCISQREKEKTRRRWRRTIRRKISRILERGERASANKTRL